MRQSVEYVVSVREFIEAVSSLSLSSKFEFDSSHKEISIDRIL